MPYFLTFFIFLIEASLVAKDFGTYGKTYPIDEEDIIEVLKNRLSTADFESKQELWKKTLVEIVETPRGRVLPRAAKERKLLFDPTIVVQNDVKDLEGKTFALKGTKVNPLDKHKLEEPLLFFDGNDEKQINWAKNNKGMWILIQGNPLEIEKNEHRPVYFDQKGYLSKKLGICALPALVTQEGKLLSIVEAPCF